MAAPPQFLNLDIVLKSNLNLDALVEHLDERVFVISHQEYERQFILVLELAEQTVAQMHDAQSCTQQLLTIINALPETAMNLWKACTSRTFSYGFDGGADHPALDTTISADLVRQIARIDADIEITVYPYRQNGRPNPHDG